MVSNRVTDWSIRGAGIRGAGNYGLLSPSAEQIEGGFGSTGSVAQATVIFVHSAQSRSCSLPSPEGEHQRNQAVGSNQLHAHQPVRAGAAGDEVGVDDGHRQRHGGWRGAVCEMGGGQRVRETTGGDKRRLLASSNAHRSAAKHQSSAALT
jgi:hypothetical protein